MNDFIGDKECVTHHNACDCREAYFARLQNQIKYRPLGLVDAYVANLKRMLESSVHLLSNRIGQCGCTSDCIECQENKELINEINEYLKDGNIPGNKLQTENRGLKTTLRKICASKEIMETRRFAREALEALNNKKDGK